MPYTLVSIVMPVFNGENYIARNIMRAKSIMDRQKYPYEIIVVDDGSRDETRREALKATRLYCNVKVVGFRKNKGKAAAFLYGYKVSRGDLIVLLDADLDVPPRQIDVLLAALEVNNADIAITSKWHPLSKVEASKLRSFMSKCYNLLVRFITGIRTRDTQTGAKAFRRYVLDAIAPKMYVKRYAFDVEILLLATKHGFRIVETPSVEPIRLNSTLKPKEILRMFLDLLSIVYRHGRLPFR